MRAVGRHACRHDSVHDERQDPVDQKLGDAELVQQAGVMDVIQGCAQRPSRGTRALHTRQ